MHHKRNTTNRKRKRIKRVLTPRNRMRKRRSSFVTDAFYNKSTKTMAYSRKRHKKRRTKTIKRYQKRTKSMKGGGFSDEELRLGVFNFATNDDKIIAKFKKDDIKNANFDDIKNLPLLMTIYSELKDKEKISGATEIVIPKKKRNGIQLNIIIGTPTPPPSTGTTTAGGGGELDNDNSSIIYSRGGKPETKVIPNTILMKFVIRKIYDIERKYPHPDLLNTFLYFFDLIDFPAALAMIKLYLTELYELTRGKNMSLKDVTTHLEKNLKEYQSVEDWQTAFNTVADEDEKEKMILEYTNAVNKMDMFDRANTELNALFSSAWAPYDSNAYPSKKTPIGTKSAASGSTSVPGSGSA